MIVDNNYKCLMTAQMLPLRQPLQHTDNKKPLRTQHALAKRIALAQAAYLILNMPNRWIEMIRC